MLLTDTLHWYCKAAVVDNILQLGRIASELNESESLLLIVLSSGPGIDALGMVSFNTSTCLFPMLHCPRKLHNDTIKLYRVPGSNILDGMIGGGVKI